MDDSIKCQKILSLFQPDGEMWVTGDRYYCNSASIKQLHCVIKMKMLKEICFV